MIFFLYFIQIESGIALVGADGAEIVSGERSKVASKKAVMETVYSRIALQV